MKNTKPLILLVNDDGIDAPGLEVLYEAVKDLGDIAIVAPDGQRSAASHAISVDTKMAYRRVEKDGVLWGHALDGSPADCVKLAVTKLLDRKPNLVLSGINPGANLGNNILYSGTVAAAREGAMLGIPSIALSIQRGSFLYKTGELYFETPIHYIRRLIPEVLERGLPRHVTLNVNCPNLPLAEVKGVVVSKQGRTMIVDKMEPSGENGAIQAYSNLGNDVLRSEPSETECDDVVLSHGKISITPIHFDLTLETFRSELTEWAENL